MIIAILAAMDKELALLRNLLENETIEQLDKLTVYIGSIAGHGIILSKCGIGKVNAALNTYRIIQNFHPELVINCGVAGGAGGLHVGDLLAAGAVAYHDVWCGPGTQPGNADACPAIFEPYAPVIDIARNRLAGEHTSFGLIATGDIFISKKEEVAHVKEIYPEAVAVDMESAAIAHVCYSEGVPFNIIRVVSDTPGEAENISQYKNFWSEAPAKTFHAIETILKELHMRACD